MGFMLARVLSQISAPRCYVVCVVFGFAKCKVTGRVRLRKLGHVMSTLQEGNISSVSSRARMRSNVALQQAKCGCTADVVHRCHCCDFVTDILLSVCIDTYDTTVAAEYVQCIRTSCNININSSIQYYKRE